MTSWLGHCFFRVGDTVRGLQSGRIGYITARERYVLSVQWTKAGKDADVDIGFQRDAIYLIRICPSCEKDDCLTLGER